jgi:hypothetical protein
MESVHKNNLEEIDMKKQILVAALAVALLTIGAVPKVSFADSKYHKSSSHKKLIKKIANKSEEAFVKVGSTKSAVIKNYGKPDKVVSDKWFLYFFYDNIEVVIFDKKTNLVCAFSYIFPHKVTISQKYLKCFFEEALEEIGWVRDHELENNDGILHYKKDSQLFVDVQITKDHTVLIFGDSNTPYWDTLH